MGKYFLDDEKVRVEFKDGEWVDIKEELTQEDQDYIMNQMASAGQNGDKAKLQFKLGQMSLLERSIVDWSFADGETKIPVTPENISRLRLRYRTKVLGEINRLSEVAGEFVRKN